MPRAKLLRPARRFQRHGIDVVHCFRSQTKKFGTTRRGQIVERVKLRLNQLELLSTVECGTALAAAASLEELTSQQV